jgi:hypothetical protein
MKVIALAVPVLVTLSFATAAPRHLQAAAPDETLAVPGYPVARDVPGAHELPDAKRTTRSRGASARARRT